MSDKATICWKCEHYVDDGLNEDTHSYAFVPPRNLCGKHTTCDPVTGVIALVQCIYINRGNCKSFEALDADHNIELDRITNKLVAKYMPLRERFKHWLWKKRRNLR